MSEAAIKLQISGHEIKLSHPDKVLFPKDGYTKRQIADYYRKISKVMLPHIEGRALTMKRYPEGIHKGGFFNKHAPDYFPPWVERARLVMHSDGSKIDMVLADEAADLVYFVQQNVIVLHMSPALAKAPRRPDQVIFDFDPSDNDFEKVRVAALSFIGILKKNKLPFFLKTTGSRGVHVHISLKPQADFDRVKQWARSLAGALNKELPALTTLEHRKAKRGNRVFIDILRNDYAQTAVAPYSLRACDAAPVATPIDLTELKDKKTGPQSFNIENIFRRLSRRKDPWKDFKKKAINASELEKTCSKL